MSKCRVRYITNKYIQRTAQIDHEITKWNKSKFFELNVTMQIGQMGAWLELLHETKDFGVYDEFGLDRGFTSDSNMNDSQTKNSFDTHNMQPDSWSYKKSPIDSLYPNMHKTPQALRSPNNNLVSEIQNISNTTNSISRKDHIDENSAESNKN